MGKIYTLLAALAIMGTLIGAAYLKGRMDGTVAEALRNAAAVEELNQQLADKDQELTNLELARLEQMRLLEERVEGLTEEAREDVNATRPAIGVGSVYRLNSITED